MNKEREREREKERKRQEKNKVNKFRKKVQKQVRKSEEGFAPRLQTGFLALDCSEFILISSPLCAHTCNGRCTRKRRQQTQSQVTRCHSDTSEVGKGAESKRI